MDCRRAATDRAEVSAPLPGCPGFHQHHRDVLQKALIIPGLLANALLTSLAVELLALEETAA